MCMLSRFRCVRLSVTPWTVVCQAPLSMGFSRQECWSGLPFLLLGDLPDTGIGPPCLKSPALAFSLPLAPPGKPQIIIYLCQFLIFSNYTVVFKRMFLFKGNVQSYLDIEGPHISNLLSKGSEISKCVCVCRERERREGIIKQMC